MSEYKPEDFISSLKKKMGQKTMPPCSFCGGKNFTTTEYVASIIIGQDTNSVTIGPNMPSGMVICENCGHIDFFALGALGMLGDIDNE